MQTLCPSEIQAIKDDITEKELVSAEILSGVYDHFLSHLENQGVEKSQNEMGELDHVYSKQYCHALQPKLRKKDCKKNYADPFRMYFVLIFVFPNGFIWRDSYLLYFT